MSSRELRHGSKRAVLLRMSESLMGTSVATLQAVSHGKEKGMKEHRLYLRCECGSADHLVQFYMDEDFWDDGYSEMLIHTCMDTWRGFWRRLETAVRYILNRSCQFGNWTEVIVQPCQARELIDLLELFLKTRGLEKE